MEMSQGLLLEGLGGPEAFNFFAEDAGALCTSPLIVYREQAYSMSLYIYINIIINMFCVCFCL